MRLARIAGIVGALLCALPAHADEMMDDREAMDLMLEESKALNQVAKESAKRFGLDDQWVKYCELKVLTEIPQEEKPRIALNGDLSKIRDRILFMIVLKDRRDYSVPAVTLCLANASNALRAASRPSPN